ncbi:Cytochrome c oxidase assembly protein cox18, mitochondrial [Desmophyllum pertusum]|uniref:Cytochrome c oxidase assembly protein cox18, mitochondrial n=1 Tax=Desmophyllum pertusum TaxID=174260 RepID=A0A9W9ZG72_9CNID|nr:Cytochrome c oxidase assembly protein cox18, mitochondrial [Desmophyllum pertusum]
MITVPLAVHQNKLLAEIELRQPTINMMAEALKHRVAGECHRLNVPADEANRKLIKQQRKMIYNYYKSEGLNPLKLYFLPWTQLPLWFFLSLSLRNLAGFFPWQRNEGNETDPSMS